MKGSIIADFVKDLVIEDLPAQVVEAVKRTVLDTLGVGLAGSRQDISRIVRQIFSSLLMGGTEARIWGRADKTSCLGAALVNSVAASCLDADDGHRKAMGHAGAAIVPTVIAVGECNNTSGRELIEAIVVGCEIAIRAGAFLNRDHIHLYHGSGTWNTIGAAAASARLLKLDPQQCLSALGLAELNAPRAHIMDWLNLRQPLPQLKETMGWGTFSGICAAFLAKGGLNGSFSLPEQDDGHMLIQGLGKDYEITRSYFKLYSACRWTHPTIDGILDCMGEHDLTPDKIEKMEVVTHQMSSYLDNPRPGWAEAGQYSIPFTIAAAMIHGNVGPQQMTTDVLNDRAVLDLADKITVRWDPELDTVFPATTSSRLIITTKEAKTITVSDTAHTRGDYQEPLSWSELVEKFHVYTSDVLSANRREAIIKRVEDLERLDNVCQLTELIAPEDAL